MYNFVQRWLIVLNETCIKLCGNLYIVLCVTACEIRIRVTFIGGVKVFKDSTLGRFFNYGISNPGIVHTTIVILILYHTPCGIIPGLNYKVTFFQRFLSKPRLKLEMKVYPNYLV